jgi:hypothetical protein
MVTLLITPPPGDAFPLCHYNAIFHGYSTPFYSILPHPLFPLSFKGAGVIGFTREASPLFDSTSIYFLKGEEGIGSLEGLYPFKPPPNFLACLS